MSEYESKLLDWQVRYQNILGVRYSDKQIERALASLVKDISAYRSDIAVQQFEAEGQDLGKYLIVGDLQRAKRVICTYYDTPMRHFGSYQFFNQDKQSKKSLSFTIVSTLLWLVLGLVGIFAYQAISNAGYQFPTWQLVVVGLIIFVYFFILSKLARGLPRKKNAVRNTSSVLVMLDLISETSSKNTAFVFIPNGSYGMQSLHVLEGLLKQNQHIIYLDSIGSDQTLYHLSKQNPKTEDGIVHQPHAQRSDYIISARVDDEGYYLTQSDLANKTPDLKRIQKLSEYIRRL